MMGSRDGVQRARRWQRRSGHEVRCIAPKRGRKDVSCGSFVARVPTPPAQVRLVGHSNDASPADTVATCPRCFAMHAISPRVG